MSVGQSWYLLKNRRYEGPFELEDLNLRAEKGQLSPDDYLIEEKNFSKGQMVYRRAAEVVARDCFSVTLSVPEVSEAKPAVHSGESRRESNPSSGENFRPAQISNRSFQEDVSPLRDGISRLSFGNAMAFCGVVLAATWLFNTQNTTPDNRQPAEFAEQRIKQQPTREVATRENSAQESDRAPIQKLRPTERPTRVAEQPSRATTPAGDRINDRINERGLASENPSSGPERIDPESSSEAGPDYSEQRPILDGEEPPLPFEDAGSSEVDVPEGSHPDGLMEPALEIPEGEAY